MSTATVVTDGSGDAGGFRTDPTSTGARGLRVHTLRPRRTLARSIGFPGLALAVDPADLALRTDLLTGGFDALPVRW